MTRARDQYHRDALAWHRYLIKSRALVVTTEAVCWEWLNAMSGAATRKVAADGFERIHRDPLIEVIQQTEDLSQEAFRLFSSRSDKDWSLTDCLSFVVMEHFEQAGFRAVLSVIPPVL